MNKPGSRNATLWVAGLVVLAVLFSVWAALALRSLWSLPTPVAVAAEWGRTCWRVVEETARSAGAAGRRLPATVGLFLAGSLLYGGIRGGLSYARTRRLLRSLVVRGRGAPGTALSAEAFHLGADVRVHVVEDPELFAFTGGFLEPAVYVSRAMAEGFSAEELRSVLRHEAEHVSRRDPLRGWVADTIARALWFLPVADDLRRRFLAASEESADDRAAAGRDGPLALASALVKAARGKARSVYIAAPGFGGELSVTERVERLVGAPTAGPTKGKRRKSTPTLARSVGVVVLLGILSLGGFPLAEDGGPRLQATGPGPKRMMGPRRPSSPTGMGGPMWMREMSERMRLRGSQRQRMQRWMERMHKRGGPPHGIRGFPADGSDPRLLEAGPAP